MWGPTRSKPDSLSTMASVRSIPTPKRSARVAMGSPTRSGWWSCASATSCTAMPARSLNSRREASTSPARTASAGCPPLLWAWRRLAFSRPRRSSSMAAISSGVEPGSIADAVSIERLDRPGLGSMTRPPATTSLRPVSRMTKRSPTAVGMAPSSWTTT